MTIGQKLRFYRTAEGYSQETIAAALSIDRSTYTYYETGKTQPSLQDALFLAKLYGITMEMLVSEEYIPEGGEEFLQLRDRDLRIPRHEELRKIPEENSFYKKNMKKRKEQ